MVTAILLCLLCAYSTGVNAANASLPYAHQLTLSATVDASSVRDKNCFLQLAGSTLSDSWNAIIIVALQKGPIIQFDPASGILVAPPFVYAVNVTPSGVDIHCMALVDYFPSNKRANGKKDSKLIIAQHTRETSYQLHNELINLGLPKRWHYLD